MCLPDVGGRLTGAATPLRAVRAPVSFGGANRLDLTHVFRAGFPVAIYEPPVREPALRMDVEGYHSQWWRFHEHSGTHVDAPAHFFADGADATAIPADRFTFAAAVVDVRDATGADVDYAVGVDDLRAYERRHGAIPAGAGVFMRSGWDERAGDPDAFCNRGDDDRFHGPGWGDEAVDWLVEHRDITCLGVDTFSLDIGPSQEYPAHRRLLGAGRYGIEGVNRLGRLPPVGAVVNVGLVPFENGSGGPCRLIAAW